MADNITASAPTRSSTNGNGTLHDTEVLPGWWMAAQKHLFMAAFVLASGFIIAEFLTAGLGTAGTGQNDILSMGAFIATAVVGGLCGGMTVLCSVATKAYWDRGRKLLSLFAFALMVLFGLVEFYAGLVDRMGNVPTNKVDVMVLSWLGLSPHVPMTPTQIVIAASVSLIGIAWGFAQYQPPKVALEDAEEEHAREMLRIRHQFEKRAAQAAGVREVTLVARGKAPAMQASAPAMASTSVTPGTYPLERPYHAGMPTASAPFPHDTDADTDTDATTADGNTPFPHQLAALPAVSRPLPGSAAYPDFVASRWAYAAALLAGSGQPLTWADVVRAVGDTDEQVRAGVNALCTQESSKVPAGRRPRQSKYQALYDMARI